MTQNTISLPKHLSFSAKETLERCAKMYFLKYLAKAPKTPGGLVRGRLRRA
jgi:hypothetical protein